MAAMRQKQLLDKQASLSTLIAPPPTQPPPLLKSPRSLDVMRVRLAKHNASFRSSLIVVFCVVCEQGVVGVGVNSSAAADESGVLVVVAGTQPPPPVESLSFFLCATNNCKCIYFVFVVGPC